MAERSAPEASRYHPAVLLDWVHLHCPGLWQAMTGADMKLLWEMAQASTWSSGRDSYQSLTRLQELTGLSRNALLASRRRLEGWGLLIPSATHRGARGQDVRSYSVSYPRLGARGFTFCATCRWRTNCEEVAHLLTPGGSESAPVDHDPRTWAHDRAPDHASHSSGVRTGSAESALPGPFDRLVEAVRSGALRDIPVAGVEYRATVSADGHAVVLTHMTSGHQIRVASAADVRRLEGRR